MVEISKTTLYSTQVGTLPLPNHHDGAGKRKHKQHALVGLTAVLVTAILFTLTSQMVPGTRGPPKSGTIDLASFFSLVNLHDSNDICPGAYGQAISHSGYIGLKDDKPDSPRRSFFWLFDAQNGDPNAPVILTTGGGPGTSGLVNPMIGQSHCAIGPNGTTQNPHAWTEHFNLLALDHPIGAGFSYGTRVNTARDAALDAYDFLQKFYVLFPHLAKNPLIVASGSYGGTYVPHIATAIHEGNLAIAKGTGNAGAQHINLESMMVSNPYSDAMSYYRWALQQRCYYTQFFNSSTCNTMYERLPFCLEALQIAYRDPTVQNRVSAMDTCGETQPEIVPGRSYENIEEQCDGTLEDCIPHMVWAANFLNNATTKARLGVSETLNFTSVNMEVNREFYLAGDLAQPVYLLYEPLLAAGIRLLHYVGKLDANCGWPGIISFLKFIHSSFQSEFIVAPDLRWKDQNATVRAIGEGAGNMTYILMERAGHMVVRDQPALVKTIVERWIRNQPFEVEQLEENL